MNILITLALFSIFVVSFIVLAIKIIGYLLKTSKLCNFIRDNDADLYGKLSDPAIAFYGAQTALSKKYVRYMLDEPVESMSSQIVKDMALDIRSRHRSIVKLMVMMALLMLSNIIISSVLS